MKNELDINKLEKVYGGTGDELADLANAFSSGNVFATNCAYVPAVNEALAYEMRRQLKQLGIKAIISTGIAGINAFSSPNEYYNMATGERMSHIEVLALIQAKG